MVFARYREPIDYLEDLRETPYLVYQVWGLHLACQGCSRRYGGMTYLPLQLALSVRNASCKT